MLRGIPNIISPELMKILMEMGHGDEIAFADANFPAASHARRLVRCDGHGIVDLLEAILPFFPLDSFVKYPSALMAIVPGHEVATPIWNEYRDLMQKAGVPAESEHVERSTFYERVNNAYAVVATGEEALYADIILKKGLIAG